MKNPGFFGRVSKRVFKSIFFEKPTGQGLLQKIPKIIKKKKINENVFL